MKTLQTIKDTVAREAGFHDYNEYYRSSTDYADSLVDIIAEHYAQERVTNALKEAAEEKDKYYFKKLGEECFDAMMKTNPNGGLKEFIRIAAEFGYKKSQEPILSLIKDTNDETQKEPD